MKGVGTPAVLAVGAGIETVVTDGVEAVHSLQGLMECESL